MIAQPDIKRYTTEDYLELETASEIRHEFHDGEMISRIGGTPDHNEMTSNLVAMLKTNLRGKAYRVFILDQRHWIPRMNRYTYPDVMVVPKPLELQTGRTDTVTNPCFIAEVLSKSTQNYDRGDKFLAYRKIATLQEYLLIDQYRIHCEHYVKTADHQWLLTESDDPSISLTLNSVHTQMQLTDLYENIDFAEA